MDPTMAREEAVRPWSTKAVQQALAKETEYHRYLLGDRTPIPSPNLPWKKELFNKVKRIPDEEWTVFPGIIFTFHPLRIILVIGRRPVIFCNNVE